MHGGGVEGPWGKFISLWGENPLEGDHQRTTKLSTHRGWGSQQQRRWKGALLIVRRTGRRDWQSDDQKAAPRGINVNGHDNRSCPLRSMSELRRMRTRGAP